MKHVYKYSLQTTGEQLVYMPIGAVPLCVQVQNGVPWLWALVVDDDEMPYTVHTFGTGHPIPDVHQLAYVGTYQMHEGALVFHVFIEEQP